MRNELVNKLLGEPMCNMCQSFFDGFIEKNVERRHQMGLKQILIRQMVANCCDWCRNLAGVYDYNDAPDDIYRRHDNCRCMVTFKSEKRGYKDVHSRQEFKRYRDARIARLEQVQDMPTSRISRIAKIRDMQTERSKANEIERIKRIARAEGKAYVDVTEQWLKYKLNGELSIDKSFRRGKSVTQRIGDRTLVFDPTPEEIQDAKLLAKTLGGVVEVLPRVTFPQRIRTADYRINGVLFDRKGPKGSSSRTIKNNIEDAKGQASGVVLNVTKINRTKEQVRNDIDRIFYDNECSHLNALIVIDSGKIIKVYEKI